VGALTVAVVGARGVAPELGKKSTESDLTLYHRAEDDHVLTIIEPTQYPEKFAPLLHALALSDRAILSVDALDRTVAECAATLDLVDLPVEIRVGPAVGEEELRRALRGLRLAEAPILPRDLLALRDELGRISVPDAPGAVRVVIDHYFPVKGVGTVALGIVRRGTLRAHETLRLYPSAKSVEIRSIQVHDVEVPTAASGTRVGAALKGVEVDELSRGQQLAPDGSLEVGELLRGSDGRRSKYYRGDLGEGARVHALVGAQFVPALITAFAEGTISLTTDRPVAWAPGETMLLADLNAGPGSRAIGRWTLGRAAPP
jgi:selenocysteine-specific translation elongation factor